MTVVSNPVADTFLHWQQLNDWLSGWESLWRPSPFAEPLPGWTRRFPGLSHWVGILCDEDLDDYDRHPDKLAERLADSLPELERYASLVSLPTMIAPDDSLARCTLPETIATDMPGRKRLQAGAFTASLLPLREPVLDWCCGKGHLSRALVRAGAPRASGLEWNGALVADGNRLAQRYGDPVRIETCDVMSDSADWNQAGHGVALHACGDLHRRLLTEAVAQDIDRVSFSPCCYHLTTSEEYQPLSARARNSSRLRLLKEEMRLAVRETVTAPQRVRKQGNRASQWRLGFDGLQRAVTGSDRYLPVPSHPTRLMKEGFEAFCHWAAEQKGLIIPPDTDFNHWLTHGARRLAQLRRHELVRHLFRRPLEVWFVLDYALFLEEAGYRVRLGTFCHRSLTPRNLLLDAQRA